MSPHRRLPGIRIVAPQPVVAQGLPTMDTAVFVGLAERGPVHRPVAIDTPERFRAVFGGELAPAYDPALDTPARAHLGAAVLAFFANGGRHCRVIRVARNAALEAGWARVVGRAEVATDVATANRLPVPGVLALATRAGGGDTPTLTPTLAPALAIARSLGAWSDGLRLTVARSAVGFRVLSLDGSTNGRLRLRTDLALAPGDLIELGEDPVVSTTGIRRFAEVEQVGPGGTGTAEVLALPRAAFSALAPGPLPVPMELAAGPAATALLLGTDSTPPPPSGQVRLLLAGALPDDLDSGRWLGLRSGAQRSWLRVDRIKDRADGLVVEGPAWREEPAGLIAPIPTPLRGARVGLELRVDARGETLQRLADIGLTPGHPAAWSRRLDDDRLYDVAADAMLAGPTPLPTNATAAPAPRIGTPPLHEDDFPLAADPAETAAGAVWLPLGVDPLFGAALGPLPQAAGALQRDGLSRFDAELFLDPDLAELPPERLLDEAFRLRHAAPRPRRLFGIHAALDLGGLDGHDAPSLITVPDAVHPGWLERPVEALPAAAPETAPPAHWLGHRGPCLRPVEPGIDTVMPARGRFLDCTTRALAAPVINPVAGPVRPGAFTLSWPAGDPAPTIPVIDFLLEESRDGSFTDARPVYRGAERRATLITDLEGIYYYRVTACDGGEQSPPSAPVTVLVRAIDWVLRVPGTATGADLTHEPRRIHRALLRLAAAHGELFAVLGLPRRLDADAAVAYADQLRADLSGGPGDRRALSFGAIYHPWLELLDPNPASRASTTIARPPDGAVAGLMAARARERGAWIAPANVALTGPVALTPTIDPTARLSLQEGRINLIRAAPDGFLTLAAETLADHPDWTAINVRRLFCLLRRVCRRRGSRYVFEPNGPVLRRAVERGFDALLGELFRRGAFAGATEAESFRVRAGGDGLGRRPDVLLVELRVAPALPLRFLTLQLLQQGEQIALAEVA